MWPFPSSYPPPPQSPVTAAPPPPPGPPPSRPAAAWTYAGTNIKDCVQSDGLPNQRPNSSADNRTLPKRITVLKRPKPPPNSLAPVKTGVVPTVLATNVRSPQTSHLGDEGSASSGSGNASPRNIVAPIKTLEEREQEYNEARKRIFGMTSSEEQSQNLITTRASDGHPNRPEGRSSNAESAAASNPSAAEPKSPRASASPQDSKRLGSSRVSRPRPPRHHSSLLHVNGPSVGQFTPSTTETATSMNIHPQFSTPPPYTPFSCQAPPTFYMPPQSFTRPCVAPDTPAATLDNTYCHAPYKPGCFVPDSSNVLVASTTPQSGLPVYVHTRANLGGADLFLDPAATTSSPHGPTAVSAAMSATTGHTQVGRIVPPPPAATAQNTQQVLDPVGVGQHEERKRFAVCFGDFEGSAYP